LICSHCKKKGITVKKCTNRGFDIQKGIVCGLTKVLPDFERTCPDYVLDVKQEAIWEKRAEDQLLANAVASRSSRFANYVIDHVILFILNVAATIVFIVMGEISFVEGFGSYLISVLISLAYYLIMEAAFGQTVGKMITRTKLVMEDDGSTPGFSAIMMRTLYRFIPFEVFSFFGEDAIGWHDSLSKTRVVRVDEFEI
jgi:uncharacterized RDD family membrane protein YckC